MNNSSLKEQLQALSLHSNSSQPENSTISGPKTKSHKIENNQRKKSKPGWLAQMQYGVELLKAHFPACFKEPKEIKPLKVGIKQDLVKLLGSKEDIAIGDKACMVASLAYYVNSIAYHKNVVTGAMRIDLDGTEVSAVSPEEAAYSAECCIAKLNKVKQKKQANQN